MFFFEISNSIRPWVLFYMRFGLVSTLPLAPTKLVCGVSKNRRPNETARSVDDAIVGPTFNLYLGCFTFMTTYAYHQA